MNRLREIDVERGIVILLVVLGHLVQFDGFIWSCIFAFHMPFFFFISGYCSSQKTFDVPLSVFLKKNIKSYLLPTLICRIILILTGVSGISQIGFSNAINYILSPSSEWFIAALFLARLLCWIYFQLLKRFDENNMKVLFSIFIVSVLFFISNWMRDSGLHNRPEKFPFPIDCALIGLSFLIAGFYLKNYVLFTYKILGKYKKECILLILVCVLFIKNDEYVNLADMYLGRTDIFYYFVAIFFSLILANVSLYLVDKFPNSIGIKLLELLGRNTILIYPGHAILFFHLNKYIYKLTGVEYQPMINLNWFLIAVYFIITLLVFIPVCIINEKFKKKSLPLNLSILVIVLFVVCLMEDNASSIGFEGNGTKENPYKIESVEDLVHFRDLVNGGNQFANQYFYQTKDLDLSGIENWEPIGVYDSNAYFYGTYDGGGNVIKNITIKRADNCGLFGVLGGTIANLGIESGSISGICVGAFASHATIEGEAQIINCYNKATVSGILRAGGIADNFNGKIYLCWNMGNISSETGVVGGIVSYNANEVYGVYSVGTNVYGETFGGVEKLSREVSIEQLEMENSEKEVLNRMCQLNLKDFNLKRIYPLVYKDGEMKYLNNPITLVKKLYYDVCTYIKTDIVNSVLIVLLLVYTIGLNKKAFNQTREGK